MYFVLPKRRIWQLNFICFIFSISLSPPIYSQTSLSGDINDDRKVDYLDLFIFHSFWKKGVHFTPSPTETSFVPTTTINPTETAIFTETPSPEDTPTRPQPTPTLASTYTPTPPTHPTGVADCGTLPGMYINVTDSGGQLYNFWPTPSCENLVTRLASHTREYVNPGNFRYTELDCNHGSLSEPHPNWQWDATVSELFQTIRNVYGGPIFVTNAFRCPRKNNSVGSSYTSKHAYGRAFDYQQNSPYSQNNWGVAQAAEDAGVSPFRILLYNQTSAVFQSFQWLKNNGYGPTHLPPGWTRYNHGHIDSGNPW